jgi:hypothetical protein
VPLLIEPKPEVPTADQLQADPLIGSAVQALRGLEPRRMAVVGCALVSEAIFRDSRMTREPGSQAWQAIMDLAQVCMMATGFGGRS